MCRKYMGILATNDAKAGPFLWETTCNESSRNIALPRQHYRQISIVVEHLYLTGHCGWISPVIMNYKPLETSKRKATMDDDCALFSRCFPSSVFALLLLSVFVSVRLLRPVSICLSAYLGLYLSVCPPVCLSGRLFARHSFISLSLSLSLSVCVCLSVCLSLSFSLIVLSWLYAVDGTIKCKS